MSNWNESPNWNLLSTINNGKEFSAADGLLASDVVRIVENLQYLYNNTGATNLENGTGLDTLVLNYSGVVDETHYASSTTGESDVCLGEANTSSGKRNVIGGKLNQNTGSNNLITGLRNNISSNHSVVGGQQNTNSQGNSNLIVGQQNTVKSGNNVVAGKENTVTINGQSNLIVGEQNILGRVTNSIICGDNDNIEIEQLIGGMKAGLDLLNNSDIQGKALFGQYNKPKTNTLLEVGNGTGPSAGLRKNALEVLKDGRVKVQTAPVDDDDVVRKGDLTGSGGGGKLYLHSIRLRCIDPLTENQFSSYITLYSSKSNEMTIDDLKLANKWYTSASIYQEQDGMEYFGCSFYENPNLGIFGVKVPLAGESSPSSVIGFYININSVSIISDTYTEI